MNNNATVLATVNHNNNSNNNKTDNNETENEISYRAPVVQRTSASLSYVINKTTTIADVEAAVADSEDDAAFAEGGDRYFFGSARKRRKLLFDWVGKSSDRAKSRPLPRLVAKNGECLIRPKNLPNKLLNTYRNWFHLLIEISWRNVLLIFLAGFIGSWLFFGLIYYLIVQYYDYYSDEIRRYESHQCIANVHSFISAFLFSLESQHTIGYGVRYITEMCPPAYFVLCVQLIVGVLAQTLLAGIVIAKILRPKKRKQEMRFSRSAVVTWPMEEEDELITNVIPYCLSHTSQVADQLSIASLSSVAQPPPAAAAARHSRQNSLATARTRFSTIPLTNATVDTVSQSSDSCAHKPVLMIRLADVQHRLYLAESHVRLYMAITKINAQGKKELIGIRDMNVGYDNGTDRVLLLWPVLIRHIIDDDSPFYGMTPEKAQSSTDFELIMTIEGIVEATGMTFQARTSFLPNEIKWGQRFMPIVTMNSKTNNFEVDYSLFDATKPSVLPPELLGVDDGTPMKKRSETTNPPANLFTTTIDELSTNMTMPSENRSATVLRHTSSAARRAENHRAKRPLQNDIRKSINGNTTTVNRKDRTSIPAIDSEEGEEFNADDDAYEYCRGGDANLDSNDANDCDVGSKPLLLMHSHPQTHHTSNHHSSHHGDRTYHHHFHQRHRHHSSSGFT